MLRESSGLGGRARAVLDAMVEEGVAQRTTIVKGAGRTQREYEGYQWAPGRPIVGTTAAIVGDQPSPDPSPSRSREEATSISAKEEEPCFRSNGQDG